MKRKKTLIIGGVFVGILAVVLAVCVYLGVFSGMVKPQPPEADEAADAFVTYEYTEQHSNGSLMRLTVGKEKQGYYLTQCYRDRGGQYWYNTYELTKTEMKSFENIRSDFHVTKEKSDPDGEYTRGVITFKTRSGSSNYDVVPLDISQLGLIDPWNDNLTMTGGISETMSQLFATNLSQIKHAVGLDSQAQLGGYLENIYTQMMLLQSMDEDTDGQIYSVKKVDMSDFEETGYFTITVETMTDDVIYQISKDGHVVIDDKDVYAEVVDVQAGSRGAVESEDSEETTEKSTEASTEKSEKKTTEKTAETEKE